MDRKLLVLPGYLVGCGGLALITYRTILAFFSSSKAIMVHVNRFGEQYVDLVLLFFLWIVCLVGLWSLSKLLKQPGLTSEHIHEASVVLHDGGSSFLHQNKAMVSQVSLSWSGDTSGYVSVDGACLSAASVSMLVESKTLPKAF
jgi:hypothetical protein